MSLFSELKRRNVFRVALAYAVLAWVVLQLSDVLVQALELPAVWSKGVIAVLVIGTIPTLVFAWVYELTPEGVKRESEVDRSQSITDTTGRKLNIAVVVMLALAMALFVADRFVGPAQQGAALPKATAETAAEAAAKTEAEEGIPVVAVLPLQAVSTGEEGRFLASGLHDDLLTRLARLEAFRVISRTSVMEYANTTRNLREIGQELGARFIVEGGLQAIGGRVRINAQLIDARTDEHLWANTFERPLTSTNLFEVQGEIAAAIAQATHATLSPSDQATLEEVPTENLAAYQAFLRGNERFGSLTRPAMYSTIAAFEEAVALDPGFADAWAQLALARIRLFWEEGGEAGTGPDPALREQAEAALERARALEPDSAATRLAAAYVRYYGNRDYSAALLELGRAVEAAPNNREVVNLRAFLLRRLGRMDEAADILLASTRAEPNLPNMLRETPNTLVRAGRCEEALALSTDGVERFPDNAGVLDSAAWARLACSNATNEAAALARRIAVTTPYEMTNRHYYLATAGDLQGAIGTLTGLDEPFLADPVNRLTAGNLLTWTYRAMDDRESAARALETANAAASEIEEAGYGILAHRAFNAALNGDALAARELGLRALEAMPEDAMVQPDIRFQVAAAWTVAGLRDEAIGLLRENRGAVSEPVWSVIRLDPFFAPLRTHEDWAALHPAGA